MTPLSRDTTAYRRGMVLGLTLAEIVILILFILLLTLSILITRTQDRIAELENKVKDAATASQTIADLEERLKQYQGLPSREEIDDNFRELVIKRQEVDRLTTVVAALTEKNEKLTRAVEDLREIMNELAPYGTTAQDILGALEERDRRLADLLRMLQEAGFDVQDADKLADELASAAQDRDNVQKLTEDNARLQQQVDYYKAFGRSNELPPCWIDPDTKRPVYIYDVVLRSGGIEIIDRYLPAWVVEKAALPVDRIPLGRTLEPQEFLSATRGLFDWSERNECRFFVRIFDRTGPDEKDLYKRRLSTVEAHFYKLLVTDRALEPGQ